jgi:RHS repeat-associated protein
VVWFGYLETTEQYKWWHPKDHVWCEWVGERGTRMFYMQARWYDPGSGRFLSTDPLIRTAMVPQSANAYSYNNPVNRVDPTGETYITFGNGETFSATGAAGSGKFPIGSDTGLNSASKAAKIAGNQTVTWMSSLALGNASRGQTGREENRKVGVVAMKNDSTPIEHLSSTDQVTLSPTE